MKSKIIVDSCVDYNDNLFKEDCIERIPFKIIIDDEEFVDNKELDKALLMTKMKASKNKTGTSCPSPHEYLEAFEEDKNNFVVTISKNLSGSHNSAVLAREMYIEDHPDAFIHIFDCKTAVSGADLTVLKIQELVDKGTEPEKIVEEVTEYIEKMNTLLILESFDNLVKNGRISNKKAFVGSILNIVPIMCDNGNGEIVLKEQVRGKKRAYNRMIEIIGEGDTDFSRPVGIGHVNAEEKALALKEEIVKKYGVKNVYIFEAGGLSSVYAYDGGIVICY